MLPEEIKKFIEVFEKLPSIGPRQATRLAFKMVGGGVAQLEETARAILGLKKIKNCPRCFFIYSGQSLTCERCSDVNRVKDVFMIVEKETDLITIERTRKYNGMYLVLGELTKSGNLEIHQKLRIGLLKKIIEELPDKRAKEIIIALNPTTYGDLNASIIERDLKDYSQKISRLGRGIPTGGEIEFADEDTLSHSLQRRE
ncbi:MAG: toprim domain-containing protein [Candidatus Paceibacterota bacterium]|jgi:recombination protein RecR